MFRAMSPNQVARMSVKQVMAVQNNQYRPVSSLCSKDLFTANVQAVPVIKITKNKMVVIMMPAVYAENAVLSDSCVASVFRFLMDTPTAKGKNAGAGAGLGAMMPPTATRAVALKSAPIIQSSRMRCNVRQACTKNNRSSMLRL